MYSQGAVGPPRVRGHSWLTRNARGGAAGELEGGGGAGPAVGEDLAEVVADAEAELRHRLHALGAPVRGAMSAGLVGRLEVASLTQLGK